MSDSESDASNVFPFQNDAEVTTISARGPYTNMTTNMSFRNQLTSSMLMPRNFERQRYAESAYDQRSMYNRRETSPMSIRSACDMRPRNFQQYYHGMSSQQSLFNGRSGSPVSMTSIVSTGSAADIALAINNGKFNEYERRVIRDALLRQNRQRVRKRIEKRRKLRLYLKGNRRKSGDDSGELGSDSSVSSNDGRSIKTSYKENMSSSRSTRIDLSDFRKTIKDSTMLKDCSDNFRHNTFKKKNYTGLGNANNTQNFNNTLFSKQCNPMPTQKDRFGNGFLLPSQRFNRSVASSVISENLEKPCKNVGSNVMNNVKNHYAQNKFNKNNDGPSCSEEEEIFSEMTLRERSMYNVESQRKRGLDSEDESSFPIRKKSKISSPTKNKQKNKKVPSQSINANPSNNDIDLSKNFEFAKPTLPIRKSKPRVQEKLIAKSALPLTDFLEPIPNKPPENVPVLQPPNVQEKSTEHLTQLDQSETTQNNDVSMRPSFIKRKLFTQKLDVAEKANSSSDGTNSPQGNVYSLQKEKNKARKLVTNQSCLNREVQDDNNLLDLIHKIVPPDRMNITNQSTLNQTKTDVNKKDDEGKWDVTSVISMCKEDDISDTYTDEEIFEADKSTKDTKKNKNINSKTTETIVNKKGRPADKVINNNVKLQNCKVMMDRLQSNATQKQVINQNITSTHNNVSENAVTSSVKSFWDTDFESDAEWQIVLPRSNYRETIRQANATLEAKKKDFMNPTGHESSHVSKTSTQIPEVPKKINSSLMNNTVMNNTIHSMSKFNASTLSIRSHRTSKKKKVNETHCTETKTNLDNHNKILIQIDNKKDNSKERNKKSVTKTNSKADNQSKQSEKPKSKLNTSTETHINKPRSFSQTKKSPKENHPKKDKKVESPKNNNKKSQSKSKSEKSSDVANNKPKSKPGTQNDSFATKNKGEKQKEVTKVKSDANSSRKNQKNKEDIQKSPKNKPKSKTDRRNSSMCLKKNDPVSQVKQAKLNITVEPIQNTIRSDRPIRSCRTPSQNRSTELSRSYNTSDISKSLRSRVINLSSSIEIDNIKIKPRNKTVNNKNISHINTRKSDVSFSLGTDKHTPMAKKNVARSKADFFRGKRKI